MGYRITLHLRPTSRMSGAAIEFFSSTTMKRAQYVNVLTPANEEELAAWIAIEAFRFEREGVRVVKMQFARTTRQYAARFAPDDEERAANWRKVISG